MEKQLHEIKEDFRASLYHCGFWSHLKLFKIFSKIFKAVQYKKQNEDSFNFRNTVPVLCNLPGVIEANLT